jgi:hypothetical protein
MGADGLDEVVYRQSCRHSVAVVLCLGVHAEQMSIDDVRDCFTISDERRRHFVCVVANELLRSTRGDVVKEFETTSSKSHAVSPITEDSDTDHQHPEELSRRGMLALSSTALGAAALA